MKQIFSITDKEAGSSTNLCLLIVVGNRHCCLATINFDTKVILSLCHYEVDVDEENLLDSLLGFHAGLKNSYAQIIFTFDVCEHILIPSSHFNKEETERQLQFLFGSKESGVLECDYLSKQNLYNAFGVQLSTKNWLKQNFPAAKIQHFATQQITYNDNNIANSVLVDFRLSEFFVIVYKEHQLQLVQYFNYATSEDILYFLLKIYVEFSLSKETVGLRLSGLIEKDSTIYKELYKYFATVDFESIPPGIKLSASFDDFPSHYFSNICKLLQ